MTTPTVRDVLGPGGWLARIDPTWEARPGQLAMAERVAGRLAKGGVSAIEAPTGIGKTLAYLVPALLSGKRVVVSTHTKTLQDQIVMKDLPRLEQAFAAHGRGLIRADVDRTLDRALRYAPMKGRGNYLCLDRLEKKRRQGVLAFDRADGALWERLADWSRSTVRGDRAELTDLPEDAGGFHEVDARADTCLGMRCPAYEKCFVVRMRREAAEADLIVVNHHLLLADLALRAQAALAGEGRSFGSVIPASDALIVDEAHALEEIASDHFGGDVSSHKLTRWLRDLVQWVTDRHGDVDPHLEDRAIDAVARTEAVFELIPSGQGRIRLPTTDLALAKLGDVAARADVALETISASLEIHRQDPTAEGLARRIRELAASLRFVVEAEGDDYVFWVERKDNVSRLGAAPIEVSSVLADALFPAFPSTVLTSATLAVEGSAPFAYFLERVGAPTTTDTLRLDTPFRFEQQAALYVPRDLPSPDDAAFQGAVIARAQALIELMEGGAFFLFTSHKAMQEAARVLRSRLRYPILVQGEAPKMKLVETFVARAPAVLLATASFWEGVDVPGDPLRLVIIDKLPFASPADPVVAARIARIGEDAFDAYQLPAAILKLRQGFGRLVRRETDRGVVAILDARITGRSYGRRFLDALPPAARFHELEALRAWRREDVARPAVVRGSLVASPAP